MVAAGWPSGRASAQIGDVSGPGQPAPRPAAQCPQTLACTYDERTVTPAGYRFQSLTVCGANCTTQYWVSMVADGRQLLEVPPVRGGGLVAVGRSVDGGGPPAVRTVLPSYEEGAPACCPSSFADTTYTWDAGQNALVAGAPVVTPAGDDVLSAALDRLTQDGFVEIFGGP
jgi:hypothetical protein